MQPQFPTIPESIRLHLGPPDSRADDITLPFPEYIMTVASSELSPLWPESALSANIYAIISLALSRLLTSYYPSRGYDFDITSSPAHDQKYIRGRERYCNVSALAGTLIGSYIARRGGVEPLEARLSRGEENIPGFLSQSGALELARRGYTPLEILKRYFGADIGIIKNVPFAGMNTPGIGFPLIPGSRSPDVARMQIILNRLSDSYPTIPKIPRADGIYGPATADAVSELRRISGLPAEGNRERDGIINRSAWCAINGLYRAVKNLEEAGGELAYSDARRITSRTLSLGDTGEEVASLQRLLTFLSCYYPEVARIEDDGVFGEETLEAVTSAQRALGLPIDGIAGRETISALLGAAGGALERTPEDYADCDSIPFAGKNFGLGEETDEVASLQRYLGTISSYCHEVSPLAVTGYFGNHTRESLMSAQELLGLRPTGSVDRESWEAVAGLYCDLKRGSRRRRGQFPGEKVCKEEKRK